MKNATAEIGSERRRLGRQAPDMVIPKKQVSLNLPLHQEKIYKLLREVGCLDPGLLARAGLLWIIEHPEIRQEAMARLAQMDSAAEQFHSNEACIAYVRKWTTPQVVVKKSGGERND